MGWGGAVPAFRQVFSSFFIPNAGEEQKRWYDEMQQASSSGEMAARLWLSNAQLDISDTARRVTQPALVLHARQDLAVPVRGGPAPGVPPPGRSLRDAREREPHPSGRGARLGRRFSLRCARSWAMTSKQHTMAADLSELSEREREVLKLVAAGMSNEEIAERLFLSTRTVERHLSNVYAKLRLSGKSARAAAAALFSRT